jgi:hypothetical protein
MLVAGCLPHDIYRHLMDFETLIQWAVFAAMVIIFTIRFRGPVLLPVLCKQEGMGLFAASLVQILLAFLDMPKLRWVFLYAIAGYFVFRIAYLDLKAFLFPSKFLAREALDNTSD